MNQKGGGYGEADNIKIAYKGNRTAISTDIVFEMNQSYELIKEKNDINEDWNLDNDKDIIIVKNGKTLQSYRTKTIKLDKFGDIPPSVLNSIIRSYTAVKFIRNNKSLREKIGTNLNVIEMEDDNYIESDKYVSGLLKDELKQIYEYFKENDDVKNPQDTPDTPFAQELNSHINQIQQYYNSNDYKDIEDSKFHPIPIYPQRGGMIDNENDSINHLDTIRNSIIASLQHIKLNPYLNLLSQDYLLLKNSNKPVNEIDLWRTLQTYLRKHNSTENQEFDSLIHDIENYIGLLSIRDNNLTLTIINQYRKEIRSIRIHLEEGSNDSDNLNIINDITKQLTHMYNKVLEFVLNQYGKDLLLIRNKNYLLIKQQIGGAWSLTKEQENMHKNISYGDPTKKGQDIRFTIFRDLSKINKTFPNISLRFPKNLIKTLNTYRIRFNIEKLDIGLQNIVEKYLSNIYLIINAQIHKITFYDPLEKNFKIDDQQLHTKPGILDYMVQLAKFIGWDIGSSYKDHNYYKRKIDKHIETSKDNIDKVKKELRDIHEKNKLDKQYMVTVNKKFYEYSQKPFIQKYKEYYDKYVSELFKYIVTVSNPFSKIINEFKDDRYSENSELYKQYILVWIRFISNELLNIHKAQEEWKEWLSQKYKDYMKELLPKLNLKFWKGNFVKGSRLAHTIKYYTWVKSLNVLSLGLANNKSLLQLESELFVHKNFINQPNIIAFIGYMDKLLEDHDVESFKDKDIKLFIKTLKKIYNDYKNFIGNVSNTGIYLISKHDPSFILRKKSP